MSDDRLDKFKHLDKTKFRIETVEDDKGNKIDLVRRIDPAFDLEEFTKHLGLFLTEETKKYKVKIVWEDSPYSHNYYGTVQVDDVDKEIRFIIED